MRTFKHILAVLGMSLLVPVLMFEEWGWEPLARAAAQLARLPLWSRLEWRIRALPPWAAVLVFFLPILLLLPVKLCGLFLLGRGYGMAAVGVLLAAKVVGTAIVARLFQLVEPTLMQIPFFARWFPRWVAWKNAVLARARDSAPMRGSRRAREAARHWWRGLRAAR